MSFLNYNGSVLIRDKSFLTRSPVHHCVLLVVHGVDVRIVGQQEGNELHVAGDDGQVQRREAVFVAALHQVRRHHHQEVGRVGRAEAVAGAAVVQGGLSRSVAIKQGGGLQRRRRW